MDDAAVIRRLVCEVLSRDPAIEVVGTAINGRIALDLIHETDPDFVTLDMEMPVLDGLQTLRELRRTHPTLPVVMLSLATRQGASATIDALAAGASDYVTKPTQVHDLEESLSRLERELLPKIHALLPTVEVPEAAQPRSSRPETFVRFTPPLAAQIPAPIRIERPSGGPPELLCIATSTGGPNALHSLFQTIEAAPSVPVAIVQHMPPMFTQLLAERLDGIGGPLRCREAADGDILQPGIAYLAPGGRHLELHRDGNEIYARLTDGPPENSCRPAADVLFRTAAATGLRILGVVMTGMGQDGMHGSAEIRRMGGTVIAQDAATSVVWGMPGAVVEAGLADVIVPLDEIAPQILRRVNRRYHATSA